MELFEKSVANWETLEQEIEETIELIQNIRNKNETLVKNNKKLEEEIKRFNKIKKKMEEKINELLEKLNTFKE